MHREESVWSRVDKEGGDQERAADALRKLHEAVEQLTAEIDRAETYAALEEELDEPIIVLRKRDRVSA